MYNTNVCILYMNVQMMKCNLYSYHTNTHTQMNVYIITCMHRGTVTGTHTLCMQTHTLFKLILVEDAEPKPLQLGRLVIQ